jgi:hypothetical protein
MKVLLKEANAIVFKNSTFDVKPWDWKPESWDPSTHDFYKDHIWKKCQSLQISDQKEIFKVAWIEWQFDELTFWTPWKITITFETID